MYPSGMQSQGQVEKFKYVQNSDPISNHPGWEEATLDDVTQNMCLAKKGVASLKWGIIRVGPGSLEGPGYGNKVRQLDERGCAEKLLVKRSSPKANEMQGQQPNPYGIPGITSPYGQQQIIYSNNPVMMGQPPGIYPQPSMMGQQPGMYPQQPNMMPQQPGMYGQQPNMMQQYPGMYGQQIQHVNYNAINFENYQLNKYNLGQNWEINAYNVFSKYDSNNSGFIDMQRFPMMMQELAMIARQAPPNQNDCYCLMNQHDKNKDSRLDLNEFKNMLKALMKAKEISSQANKAFEQQNFGQ